MVDFGTKRLLAYGPDGQLNGESHPFTFHKYPFNIPIFACEERVVPSSEIDWITVAVDSSRDVDFQMIARPLDGPCPIQIVPGVAQVYDGFTKVPVVNNSDHSVIVYLGQQLGQLTAEELATPEEIMIELLTDEIMTFPCYY